MNERETTAVLGVLSAAWPTYELTPPTIALWAHHLAGTLPEDGLAAAHLIVRGDEHFPRLARFMETVRSVARRRVGTRQDPALTAGAEQPLDGDDARAALDKVRQAIAAAKKPPAVGGLTSIGHTLKEQHR